MIQTRYTDQKIYLDLYDKIGIGEYNVPSVAGKRSATWVYNFTRNTVTDHFRTRRTLVALEDTMVDDQPEELAYDALDSLADALPILKEKTRDLIVLHYYTSHTLKEVAEMMDMSYINAKVIHKKALESLRTFFQKE